MSNEYYVYVYLDMTKSGSFFFDHKYGKGWMYQPFYVGKGKNGRIDFHIRETKKYFDGSPIQHKKGNFLKLGCIQKHLKNKFTPARLLVDDNLTEQEAFDLEKEIIKTFGRLDNGTGFLTNMTDGGDGCINFINHWSRGKTKEDDERLLKFSERMKIHNPCFLETEEQKRRRIKKSALSNLGKAGKYERTENIKEIIRIKNIEYYKNLDKEDKDKHSELTKEGMLKKGYTSEVISELTKEGMKKVPYETLAYWKGKKQPKEMVEKRSRSLKGKKLSDETKNKIREKNIGRKHTEKTRKNMSDSKVRYHKNKITFIYTNICIDLYFKNVSLKKMHLEYNKLKPWNYPELKSYFVIKKLFQNLNFPLGGNGQGREKIKKDFIDNNLPSTFYISINYIIGIVSK